VFDSYGKTEYNAESAINILIDVVQAQKRVNMDHWSPRLPTNVEDVARVLLDIGQHCKPTPSLCQTL
jgi:S-adenosylmethionine synthetase